MSKKTDYGFIEPAVAVETASRFYKGNASIELLSNDGKVPLRVDKALIQVSGYHTGVAPMVLAPVVHISDVNGASLDAAVANGTTQTTDMETIMNEWGENVWMTDFQLVGTGFDETLVFIANMEASTRRILLPGQKLLVSGFGMPVAAESTKTFKMFVDSIIWYEAAAQK